MAISQHKTGGTLAAAIRQHLGFQDRVRKSRSWFVTGDLPEKAAEVRKSLRPQGPRSVEFAAALAQHRLQRESRRQGGIPREQILAIQRRIEDSIRDEVRPDVPDGPARIRPVAGGARASTTGPAPSDALEVVRKAEESVPGDEVDPVQVLARCEAMLLNAFRKSEGRDPAPDDADYWDAYRSIIVAIRDAMANPAAAGSPD